MVSKTADLLIVWGALFRRVTRQGRVGSIKINPYPDIDEHNRPIEGYLGRCGMKDVNCNL
jgi:hypothetical protein